MPEERARSVEAQDPSRPDIEAAVPEPRPFGPEDVVPRFRSDLRVARGSSAAFFDVTDPESGRAFTLYEFELAIARMLDGRRRVAQVIESAARLGIPVEARSLYQFVRQMWQYGFLAPPGAPAGRGEPSGTWGAREPWDEETRALFQSGQRLMRLGRNAEAAAYLEAILDAHPANAEAQELLALIARGQSLAVGRTLERAAEVWPVPPPRRPVHQHPAVLAGALVVLAVAALAAIALLVPPGVPERAGAPAGPSAAAPAPAAGAPAARTLPVERRSHPPVAEVVAPGEGELVWTRAPDAPVAKGERVGEVRAPATETEDELTLARRVAELEKLAATDPVYADFLERARRDQRDLAARRPPRILPVVAPATGLLARAPRPGGHAAAGERVARVLDAAVWHLAASADAGPPPDAACEVVGDGREERAPCRLVARGRGAGLELVAEVDAAGAPWIGTAGALWLRVAPGGAPAPPPPPAREERAP